VAKGERSVGLRPAERKSKRVLRAFIRNFCSHQNRLFELVFLQTIILSDEIKPIMRKGLPRQRLKCEECRRKKTKVSRIILSVLREGSGLMVSLSAFHMIVIGLKERNASPAREAGKTVVQMSLRVWHRSIGTKRVDKRMQTHHHLVILVLLPEDLGMREILRQLRKKHLFHQVCHSIGRRVWRKTCDRYLRERPGLFEGNQLLLQAQLEIPQPKSNRSMLYSSTRFWGYIAKD